MFDGLQNFEIRNVCRVCLKTVCDTVLNDFDHIRYMYENIAQVKVNSLLL